MTGRPHGYARYNLDSCRCYTCGWARSQYDDQRKHAIRRGTWQPWVDAAPVRLHLTALQGCGIGLRTAAALAGVDRKRLQAVLNGRPERGTGPQEKVRPALAAAVLAIEPTLDNVAPSTPIDATCTLRRLRALAAAGWPQSHIAARLGQTPANYGALLTQTAVTARVARLVRSVYDQLWIADPLDHGVTRRWADQSRAVARKRRWAPPGAWDEATIDDPAAAPEWTGACGTYEGYLIHQRTRIPTCPPCREARRNHTPGSTAA
ncbi:hypothetical protein [Kitasatospora cineracea]|uniref:hypothetical protein n=1 Tax=Kitasatospora cineracea TaxID=88074 RepID=UPI0036C1B12D